MTKIFESWGQFWFQIEDFRPLSLFRIIYGIWMVIFLSAQIPELTLWFSDLANASVAAPSLFSGISTDKMLMFHFLSLFSATLIIFDIYTRYCAGSLFLIFLSIRTLNPAVVSGSDVLMMLAALLLCVSGKNVGSVTNSVALRLLQVQLTVVYIFAASNKWLVASWRDGQTVRYGLKVPYFQFFQMPKFLLNSDLFINFSTWGVLGFETFVPLLLWFAPRRNWVLLVGIFFHILIGIFLCFTAYSAIMICYYLVFFEFDGFRKQKISTKSLFVQSTVA